ncbi:ABC-F family ATP-binding cassette domain-containing protein [Runella sp. MFBS21]|uniref:ABC-F family ATP-binding cassette domain-containing protein n=1 Tax=Runella sp. MFBS21 TaxID=3034018 RepID=UPI0023F97976|nr:ABC-F family ATP-binding cassette domain-containing protein [Runella sp. MFBS21]MDF7817585.1 ABC-F family ATP-binding cassette domain-containing protein [Runella sp. MFBS21]
MIFLQHISYIHPNKDLLFDNINLTVNNQQKIALIGHNGTGKSTLLKIIARELTPSGGHLKVESTPYYIPQIFGQYNHLTIAQALHIDQKLNALCEILNGNVTEDYLNLLADDWGIEERTQAALHEWQLDDLDWNQKMETLSGGQKTKVFLAGISIHQPELILMDEPSNHLDTTGRQQLYEWLQSTSSTVVIVSHDRQLLNLLETVCELSKRGITVFGGNYDFYVEQKQVEIETLNQDIHSKEKTLRKAKEKERETLERQQKLDARGKKKQENAGIARIMMNTLRNNAENSTAKIKSVHSEKISGISEQLHELRNNLPDLDKMKFGFDNSALHKGKILLTATNINFGYTIQSLWKENLNFQIKSGERIALKGLNGSGKTTLIRLILGDLQPCRGLLQRAEIKSVYIDQDYSLIDRQLTVYQQAQKYNIMTLQEHELKIRLNRFLFSKEKWDKPCSTLSGGESMRLMLCCLTIQSQAPDIIILDEPTNNLDLQNIGILTAAINEYQGTLIVVSHDERFLKEINIQQTLQL